MKLTNLLTLLRLLLVPVIFFLINSKETSLLLLSLLVFLFAVFTDWFDGFIARTYNLITAFGTVFDPLTDKMLILSIFFAFSSIGLIPIWMVLLLLFRELLVSGIRQLGSVSGKIIGANWMGKAKASLQMGIIVFVQCYLILKSIGYLIPYGLDILYFSTLFMVILSLIFAAVFLVWNRSLVLKDF